VLLQAGVVMKSFHFIVFHCRLDISFHSISLLAEYFIVILFHCKLGISLHWLYIVILLDI